MKKYLFLITLTYFALSFINIHLALLGMLYMALPIILLFVKKRKVWCQSYCPRACLYSTVCKINKKHSRQTPKFFINGPMKWILLGYFCLSMGIIIFSTVKVALGAPPLEEIRLFIFIPLWQMPQLFNFETLPWLTHLAYRFYSMMLSTTTLGLVFGLVFRPRTWCTICPIATVSNLYLKKSN